MFLRGVVADVLRRNAGKLVEVNLTEQQVLLLSRSISRDSM